MYIVVIEDERGALVSEHALYEGSLTLGRTPENDILLPSNTVSRHHARLSLEGMSAFIADLSSSNGVLVDDHRIRQTTRVDERNQIRIGEFRVYLERATGKLRAHQSGIGTAIVLPDHAHAKLMIISGNDVGREYLMFEPVICIGRTDENDITLADVSVSRHHARIKRNDDGSYTITDLDSSNGSWVNGRRISSPVRLRHGERLQFGNIECMLVDVEGKRHRRRPALPPQLIFFGAVLLAALIGVLLTLSLMS